MGQRTQQRQGDPRPLSTAITKRNASLNRSALDSEVLASSDDEQDSQPSALPCMVKSPQHSGRRSSWLNESQRKLVRQASHGGGDTFAPNSSTPTAPPEGSPWSSSVASAGMGHASTSSFPWGNGIWSTDVQRTSNLRMNEASASPTTRAPGGYAREQQATPPLRRDSSSDGAIPFAIPLQPTLKTYRSQSYSVGQLEQEVANSQSRHNVQASHTSRTRVGSSYGGLQRRSSRPTILGEFSPDTSILGQLREVDDDDETSFRSSEAGFRLSQSQSRTIEKLAMENALLRQQALTRRNSQSSAQSRANHPHDESPFHVDARFSQANDAVLEEVDGVPLSPIRDQVAQENYQYGLALLSSAVLICLALLLTFLGPFLLLLQGTNSSRSSREDTGRARSASQEWQNRPKVADTLLPTSQFVIPLRARQLTRQSFFCQAMRLILWSFTLMVPAPPKLINVSLPCLNHTVNPLCLNGFHAVIISLSTSLFFSNLDGSAE